MNAKTTKFPNRSRENFTPSCILARTPPEPEHSCISSKHHWHSSPTLKNFGYAFPLLEHLNAFSSILINSIFFMGLLHLRVALPQTNLNCSNAASRLSAISFAMTLGGGGFSVSSRLSSLSQNMSRLTLLRFSSSS